MAHVLTKDYHGHAIVLGDNFRFNAEGPLSGAHEYGFDSYAQTTAAIEGWLKAAEKQKRAESGVAIEMLDDKGARVVVKGIHAVTGKLLGCGVAREVYPVVPRVSELLIERERIAGRLNAITRVLSKVSVSVSRGYSRIAPDAYETAIKSLADEIASKAALAEKIG